MNRAVLGSVLSLMSGALFGAGLLLSGMNNPEKVRAFLDVFGAWQPALIAVMASAVLIFGLAFALSQRMDKPWFAERFHVPSLLDIDRRLLFGAVLFGVGWGLVGLCPGPALVNLFSFDHRILLFLLALLIGNRIAHAVVGPAK